ncbi:MAG TPA: hypothetical protein VJ802_00995 [Gemmatimonadaceae bacterium]|nr:hypothetical protein [Gemmatimonadaceae bacterium]
MTFLRIVVVMISLVALARPGAAQRAPGEVLSRGVILYEELQLERAVVLLREVTSPSNTAATMAERVQAMKYLGATFSLLGQRDSALAYFRRMLERDPFMDLDPTVFTPQERQLFSQARRETFVVGVRTLSDTGFVPGPGGVSLRFVTTQHARVQAVVRRPGETEPIAAFRWTAEGASESPWDGLDQKGARLPAGRYQLDVSATATSDSASDTVTLRFDVNYDHEPLEDSIVFDPRSLLPERRPPSIARSQLAAGLALASFAVAVPNVIGHGDLDGTRKHAVVMASVTASGGIASFFLLRRGSGIPANVLENARRREQHVRQNREIRERNAARLAAARMIITPTIGESR